jgi:general secretion pathway protein H
MPISATGNPDKAELGFTLVELTIVVLVIALASAAVVWALPDPRGRVMDEATRLAGRIRAAHEAAVVGAHPVSLWVSTGGYGFDERAGGAWVPAGGALSVTPWQAGTRSDVVAGRLRVVFDETGLADRPADVALTRDRHTAHVRVAVDGSVRVDG